MAHCCKRVSRSGARCAARSAERNTARAPCANRQRRWTSPRLLIRPKYRRPPARGLPRRESQPTREFASAAKRVNMVDRADQGGRREHAHARNGLKPLGHRMRGGDLRELAIETADLGLEFVDFLDDQRQRVPEHVGKIDGGVVKNRRHPAEHRPRADRDGVAVFSQQSSQRINARDPRPLPLRAYAMHGLQRVLVDRLHGHLANVAAAASSKASTSARSVLLRRT